MPLNNYQKMCYRWFGSIAENMASDKLKMNLERAHINMRPGAYLSYVWVNTLLTAAFSSIIFITLLLFLQAEIWVVLFLIFIPLSVTTLAYLYFMNLPSSKAKSRGKKIDLHLPYALNFISAMSSAGITPNAL